MNYIVTLHLNEIGRKALGVDEKIITIDAETKDSLTGAIIDEVFPISLVESYNVKPSFMDLTKGSYVAVVKDDVRYLGEILEPDCFYKNRILVKVYMYEPETTYTDTADTETTYTKIIMFHPNGVEVTHNKNKYCLDNISDDEVETIKGKLKNAPFIKMLNMLLKNSNVNTEEIKMPKWMSLETVNKITEILNSECDEYSMNIMTNCVG